MKKFFAIFILSLISIKGLTLDLKFDEGRLPEHVQKLEVASRYSYDFVTRHCHGDWSMAFSELTRNGMSTLMDSIERITDSDELKLRITERLGRGLQLDILLGSYGYYLGLNSCFGTDRIKKDAFTVFLILGDELGSLSGAAITGLLIAGPLKIAKWIAKTPVWLRLSPQVRKYIGLGLTGAVIAVPSAFVIVEIYEKYEKRQKFIREDKLLATVAQKKLDEVMKDRQELQAALVNPDISANDKKMALDLLKELNEQEIYFKSKLGISDD